MYNKICFIFILIFFIFNFTLNAEDPDLNKKLNEIRNLTRGANDYLELVEKFELAEKEYLKLLETYNSDEEKGKIYFEIISCYSNYYKGYEEKIQHYSELAIKLPLDILSRVKIYLRWAISYKCIPDSSVIPYYYIFDKECIEKRKKAISIALQGYNLLKDYNLPDNEQEVPVLGMDSSIYFEEDKHKESVKKMIEEQRKKKQKEIEERERIIYENHLINYKNKSFFNYCINLYTFKPYANEEFYQLMLEGLGDEDLANELLARLEEKISAQKERYKRRDEILELLKQQGE